MKGIIERGGEVIGGLFYLLPILIQLILGAEIDDIIFNKVLSIVGVALILREISIFIFWGMWITILLVFYSIRAFPVDFEKSKRNWWLVVGTRIGTGWLVTNWLLFSLIDGVFYRGAVITFPFWLGGLVLFATGIGIRYDIKLHDFIKYLGDEKERDRKTTIFGSIRLSRYIVFISFALLIMLPNQAGLAGFQAEPPALPTEYGGEQGPFDVMRNRLDHILPSNISQFLVPDNDNSSWYIFLYLPQVQDKTLPLSILAHGYTGTNPEDYENTLYQLASRGSATIFVQYTTDVELGDPFTEPEDTNFTRSNAMYFRYLMMWNGVLQAVEHLQQGEIDLQGSTISTDHIQIIGHSVGGGMVPYLATNVVNRGWGNEELILDMETPWYASEHPLASNNLSILPAHTIVNVVGTEDDHLASPCLGMMHFELFFKELGLTNLAYLIIPSDYYGFPRLVATHYVVTSTLDDTLTRWGYLKRVDAMVAFLWNIANNLIISDIQSYFLGGGTNMVSQGEWSDGTPVNPLIYSTDPYGQRGGEDIASQFQSSHEAGPELCNLY